jgi:hypothetical protein
VPLLGVSLLVVELTISLTKLSRFIGQLLALPVQNECLRKKNLAVILFGLKESILFALKITKYLGKDFAHDLESGWAKNKIKTLI